MLAKFKYASLNTKFSAIGAYMQFLPDGRRSRLLDTSSKSLFGQSEKKKNSRPYRPVDPQDHFLSTFFRVIFIPDISLHRVAHPLRCIYRPASRGSALCLSTSLTERDPATWYAKPRAVPLPCFSKMSPLRHLFLNGQLDYTFRGVLNSSQIYVVRSSFIGGRDL
ncbi:hypothetical protein ABW19_dt0202482 [Dactylella cylindrospora]|nr:hypothetical protein ABW19_dt0202482 [Dactylella cylindrospora]